MDNSTDYERAKGMHAMSDAEYEQMMRDQAPLMQGAQPWLESAHLRQAQNAHIHRLLNGGETVMPDASTQPERQSWWRRRDWWRL